MDGKRNGWMNGIDAGDNGGPMFTKTTLIEKEKPTIICKNHWRIMLS